MTYDSVYVFWNSIFIGNVTFDFATSSRWKLENVEEGKVSVLYFPFLNQYTGLQNFLFFYDKCMLASVNAFSHINSDRSNDISSPCAVIHKFSSVVPINTVSVFALFITSVRCHLFVLNYIYSKVIFKIIPIYYLFLSIFPAQILNNVVNCGEMLRFIRLNLSENLFTIYLILKLY